MKYLVAILAFAIGAAGMVAWEADDSPNIQLLGVVFIVGAVALGVRIAQRSRYHVQPPALGPRAQVKRSPYGTCERGVHTALLMWQETTSTLAVAGR